MDLRKWVWSVCAVAGLVLTVTERKCTVIKAQESSLKKRSIRFDLNASNKQIRRVRLPGRSRALTAGTTVWGIPDVGRSVSARVRQVNSSSGSIDAPVHSRVLAQGLASCASCPRSTGTESTSQSWSRCSRTPAD